MLVKWNSTAEWQTWLPNGDHVVPETVIVESRDSSGNINETSYSESGSYFSNSVLKSTAYGISGVGSRFTPSITNPSLIAASDHQFSVSPQLSIVGGKYRVDVTKGSSTNISTGITVAVEEVNCDGLPETTSAFRRTIYPNNWAKVGDVVLRSTKTNPTVTFSYLSGTLSAVGGRFSADAIRFILIGPDKLRASSSGVSLPLKSIEHVDITALSDPGLEYMGSSSPRLPYVSQIKVRYRFGQFSDNEDTALLNRYSIGLFNELGDKLTHAVVDVQSSIDADGLYCPERNSYAVLNNDSLFLYPRIGKNFYFACWIKSDILDYSDNEGYVAVCSGDDGSIAYAIYIDTDNTIKAELYDGIILESGIGIDEGWHNVLIISSRPGTSLTHYLIVDNVVVDAVTASLTDSSSIPGSSFSVGSHEYFPEKGFVGHIDEIVLGEYATSTQFNTENYRFSTHTVYSRVIDTESDDNFIARLTSTFSANNGSIEISARASNTAFSENDSALEWSHFSDPIDSEVNFGYEQLGIYSNGRYFQVRVRISPSNDALRTESPVIESLEVVFAKNSQFVSPVTTAFEYGKLIGQVCEFTGEKDISKVSISLNVSRESPIDVILQKGDYISFLAANFSGGRETYRFHPSCHFGDTEWKTSRTPLSNSSQSEAYATAEDAEENSPYISYDFYSSTGGTYQLWGYGYGDFYYSFNSHAANSASLIGNKPSWQSFGYIVLEEGSYNTFRVYLKDTNVVVFDQWYFTTDLSFDTELYNSGAESYELPLPVSSGPFNTALRIRRLNDYNDIDAVDQSTEYDSITIWKPSSKIMASGKFNYKLPEPTSYSGGLIIEFWQIGGGINHCAAWAYSDETESIGQAYISSDFGQNIQRI